jgi:hypothetical protein
VFQALPYSFFKGHSTTSSWLFKPVIQSDDPPPERCYPSLYSHVSCI